jgi:hypothetical protein
MVKKIEELVIEGITYVPKGTESTKSQSVNGMEYVIVRSYASGVHAGYLKEHKDANVTLVNSRRLWRWKGANELCDIATNGIKVADADNKISCVQSQIVLPGVCEILSTTEMSQNSILGEPEWIAKK